MVFSRYPDTATITIIGAGSKNAGGVFTEGTITTIAIACRVEPETEMPAYIKDEFSNTIKIDLSIYTPLMTQTDLLRDGKSNLFFAGKRYKIVQVPQLQKITNLKCVKN